jgi:hypothetical protein
MPWADRLGYEVSKLGEHLGLDVLRYNRTIFRMYDRLARNDAAPVMQAVQQTFPEAHSLVDVGAGTGAYAAEAARLGVGPEDVGSGDRGLVAERGVSASMVVVPEPAVKGGCAFGA